MDRHHIKILRRKHGLSADALAELIGVSQGHMSRIENGTRGLSLPIAKRIAEALHEDVQDVLGIGSASNDEAAARQFQEDAEPYDGDAIGPIKIESENISPWRVTSNACERAGIRTGDIALVDISAAAVEGVKPLQCVIAQVYSADELLSATTILRQYVPPALLIVNSSSVAEMPIDMTREDVHIKGVVVSVHRSLG